MSELEVALMRKEGFLNDLYYEDRPMTLIVPGPLEKVDEEKLEQSRRRNREMIAAIRQKQEEIMTRHELGISTGKQ